MRILHLSDYYLPRLGGIETHVAELARRQAAAGHQVAVTTLTPALAEGQDEADDGPVQVRRVSSLVGALDDVRSFDMVHGHVSAVSTFAAPLTAAATRRGVPALVTVHSLWDGLGPLPRLAVEASLLRGAPVVWSAVSRVAARQVADRLPAGQRVHVLPNAVEVAPRRGTPVSASLVSLVSTMRLARRKRPLQLVEMFAALRAATAVPVRLTIIGEGHLRGVLERRVRRLGLADAVTVTGRLDPGDVLGVVARSDVYVAPATLESFGLAALEARSLGLPVVGRTQTGLEDFVVDGQHGLLRDSDRGVVRAMRDLVEDPALRLRLAEHNRTTSSGLDWSRSLERHGMAYRAAAGQAISWSARARLVES